MTRELVLSIAASLVPGSLVLAQSAPATDRQATVVTSASELADSLAQRLGNDLHVKTVVGEPFKVGSLTLIAIVKVDVSFGGGGVVPLSTAQSSPKPVLGDAFFMSGEARPLGFVAVSKKGTRFISVAKALAR